MGVCPTKDQALIKVAWIVGRLTELIVAHIGSARSVVESTELHIAHTRTAGIVVENTELTTAPSSSLSMPTWTQLATLIS